MDRIAFSTLDRVIEIVSDHRGVPRHNPSATSTIDQDVRIVGEDVTELAVSLAEEFGEEVWQWASWPFRGSFEYPPSYEHLELGHIAAVIDRGEWFEP